MSGTPIPAVGGPTPTPRPRVLTPGQRYTLALGLLVAWFLLTVSLPNLYRAPSDGAAPALAPAATVAAPAPPRAPATAATRVQVVRAEVPAWTKALSWVLLVLVAGVLVWGWAGSVLAVRRGAG